MSARMETPVRVLVVEDEPLARARLCELLAEVPWLTCVGEAADGLTAIARIDALRPELVLLDVQLPECTGLEVLERAAYEPAVVFTTAYDRYAVAAFELEALDYVLKPFGRERLHAALERARRLLPSRVSESAVDGEMEPPAVRERARSALAGAGPLSRVLVRDRGRLVPVQLREVERLEAEDDYVALHTAGRRYLVELPLGEFEARLDGQRFVRVHRSHIVNLDFVRQLVPFDGARLMVEMHDGTKILASRTRSRDLRELAI